MTLMLKLNASANSLLQFSRREARSGDEIEKYVRVSKVFENFFTPLVVPDHFGIVPSHQLVLLLHHIKACYQFILSCCIFMCIGNEYL